MKKLGTKISVALIIAIAILVLPKNSYSDYVSNLRDQRANLQGQLDASNAQIEIIQSDVSSVQAK